MIDAGQYKDLPMLKKRYTSNPTTGINNQVKTGTGFLHSVTFSQEDAAPTAGTICIYDDTAAYGTAGKEILRHTQTTAVFMPVTVILDVAFDLGLQIGFTTTADVGVILGFK